MTNAELAKLSPEELASEYRRQLINAEANFEAEAEHRRYAVESTRRSEAERDNARDRARELNATCQGLEATVYGLRADVERFAKALGEAGRSKEMADDARCAATARAERLTEALREIAVGKTHADNGHPVGEWFSMAGRFVSIARAALVANGEPHPSSIMGAVARANVEAGGKAVCAKCNDTHRITLAGREVMCTACPTPCQRCRSGGVGPFCETTRCPCECHAAAVPR